MMDTVLTSTLPPPPVNRREILRYAGAREETPEVSALLDDCLTATDGCFSYRVAYRCFPIAECGDLIDLTFARTASADLLRALRGCDGVILFAATVGIAIDRLIARDAIRSSARALMLEAIGSERVESLCDAFTLLLASELADAGRRLRPRFSPGYGDLPLELQHEIFSALDCRRRLGISLSESLLMTPKKSVTALIGVYPDKHLLSTIGGSR